MIMYEWFPSNIPQAFLASQICIYIDVCWKKKTTKSSIIGFAIIIILHENIINFNSIKTYEIIFFILWSIK